MGPSFEIIQRGPAQDFYDFGDYISSPYYSDLVSDGHSQSLYFALVM